MLETVGSVVFAAERKNPCDDVGESNRVILREHVSGSFCCTAMLVEREFKVVLI